MREIRFFRSSSGGSPIEEFLDGLTAAQAKKVTWVLALMEDLDRLPAQYFKKLKGTDDLWEIRIQHGGDAVRLLGFFDGAHVVVLVSAFFKKSEKTPAAQLAVAAERKRVYLTRRRSN